MKSLKIFIARILILISALPFISNNALASSVDKVEMLKNINLSGASDLRSLTALNNTLYFAADDGINGYELWKSDGTASGTVLVKDINSSNGSNLQNFTALNNTLYFAADDGINGYELWKSDGTASGTVLVKDINPSDGSDLENFTTLNNTLYFSADDGVNGYELWKSDGTSSGTVLVKDINSSDGSNLQNFTVLNNTLYFAADDGINGYELWKSDGTASGTVLVKDINLSSTSYPVNLTALNNTLYFAADDGINGYELWKSDGTASGTLLVKDINPSDGSELQDFITLNNTLYFAANDGLNGNEPWKSDGTASGTVLVKDVDPNSGSNSQSFTTFNNTLYFSADDGINGDELWKSDGTASSTIRIDINLSGDSYPRNLMALNNTLYFTADDGVNGQELWKFYTDNAPVISVTGANQVSVCQNTNYVDDGATALDDFDGYITSSIITTNHVNTATIGSYTVDYSSTDSAGNITTSSRIVNVNNCTSGGGGAPVIVKPAPLTLGGKLDFSINNNDVITNSNIVNISLNADLNTIYGYAISLDNYFSDSTSIIRYSPNVTFTLPNINGLYTVYLKYYSTTGHTSDTINHSIEYKTEEITTSSISTSTSFQLNKFLFKKDLKLGQTNQDVKLLQQFLNNHGYLIAKSGPGSKGNETNYFGQATKAALIKFQKTNKINPTSGFFGSITRKLVNTK